MEFVYLDLIIWSLIERHGLSLVCICSRWDGSPNGYEEAFLPSTGGVRGIEIESQIHQSQFGQKVVAICRHFDERSVSSPQDEGTISCSEIISN